jgi:DNA end-binding protein Ku
MAKRPSWSGFLKLSLVTCPIQLYSAITHAESATFHFIHPKTHNRIHMKPFDPDLGEVERKDLVRGYEIAKGKYVTVSDEDLAAIRLKSTKTIEIERFVDFDDIDPLYFDSAYYVLPDGKMGLEAYAVIREAMKKERQAAEGRLVLSYREHAVIIQPRGEGLVLHRMRDAHEVESPAMLKKVDGVKVDSKMVAIATEIIEQKKGKFEPATFKDPYEEALITLLKRRARGAKPVHEAEEAEAPTNVVNLMDALRDSLGGKGKRAARNGGKEGKVVQFRRPAAGKGKSRAHGKPARRGTARPARQRSSRSLS